jgi:hypothetical protein
VSRHLDPLTASPVLAIAASQNAKLGGTAATYAAQVGCGGCPLLDHGCYAQTGHTGRITRRLNAAAAAQGLDAVTVAWLEAEAIADLPSRLALRIHVVGDAPTDETALPIAEACLARKGPAWGYTHFWRQVDRLSWNGVSMLASCERPADVALANARGYTAALIVPIFPSPSRFTLADVDIIPCPQQTGRAASCADCRLCWRDDYLREARLAIGFTPHGSVRRKVIDLLAS